MPQKIEAFKTTDGQIWETEEEAKAREFEMDLAEVLVMDVSGVANIHVQFIYVHRRALKDLLERYIDG